VPGFETIASWISMKAQRASAKCYFHFHWWQNAADEI